ncbi:MAG: hypothetical protein OXH19_05630 [Chloroflexi bacterium]|nr:hypothetical protein [Chloroflexota bacterium]MCY3589944.1 hypothetical protein [Chloroflexota bacterium]MCY3684615.1 hypothetical protein [Chloroflexota bacterium]MDE2709989.1 hypothetical protein [Chloroflexota bacterium]
MPRHTPKQVPDRTYPQVVTTEERAGDDEVFSEAMPLVTEWRYQHAQFKQHWPTLEGLEAEVRMLELETELIEEWELTLPPGQLPWEWDQRRRELRRRNQRLGTARANLRRRRRRRLLLRVCTLGLIRLFGQFGSRSTPWPARYGGDAGKPHRPVDAPRRVFPELITAQAEPGEEKVYGAAAELVVEWRDAWADRKQARYTLDCLRAERRRLELELRLIGVFGLTPPPADVPWGERRREREAEWRRRALRRLRWQLPMTWCLHWLLRGLTLGLWGRVNGA